MGEFFEELINGPIVRVIGTVYVLYRVIKSMGFGSFPGCLLGLVLVIAILNWLWCEHKVLTVVSVFVAVIMAESFLGDNQGILNFLPFWGGILIVCLPIARFFGGSSSSSSRSHEPHHDPLDFGGVQTPPPVDLYLKLTQV